MLGGWGEHEAPYPCPALLCAAPAHAMVGLDTASDMSGCGIPNAKYHEKDPAQLQRDGQCAAYNCGLVEKVPEVWRPLRCPGLLISARPLPTRRPDIIAYEALMPHPGVIK
jgi:hypothetical protein